MMLLMPHHHSPLLNTTNTPPSHHTTHPQQHEWPWWLGPVTGNPWVIRWVPAPTPAWTRTCAYGYVYSQVTWVPKLMWVRTTGSTWINATRRGWPLLSHWFVFVDTAGRENLPVTSVPVFQRSRRGDNPLHQFVFVDMAGRNPPCHIGLCFSTWQGGDNPLRRVDLCLSTWQGGRNPPCYIGSCFLMRQGGRKPPLCWFMCVGSRMSNGGGEQLGKGGRELELRCNVFKWKRTFYGDGHNSPSPPLSFSSPPTSPLPRRRVLGLVFLCPGRVLMPVVVWRWLVMWSDSDVWWSGWLGKPVKPVALGVGFERVRHGRPGPVPVLPIPGYPRGFVNPWRTLLVGHVFCVSRGFGRFNVLGKTKGVPLKGERIVSVIGSGGC